MSDASAHAAGWYPDPGGVHEYRFWDGSAWTEHVADRGRQSVQIHRPLGEPMRSLVVASALSIDTALKQDARGFG